MAKTYMSGKSKETDTITLGCGAIVILAIVIVIIIKMISGLMPNYSVGERTGVPVKLSYKGIIWKSYEGTMNIGGTSSDANGIVVLNSWAFSVRDKKVVDALNAAAEKGSRVTVHYHQYLISPLSIGTDYVVDGVRVNETWIVKPPGQ